MGRGADQYNWAAYYAAACERERRQNIMLAERIADAERRQEDLSDNLNRICATPFWKMTVPFRNLHQKVKSRLQENRERGRCSVKNACLLRYTGEVQRQEQPYKGWLETENNRCSESDSGEAVWVSGWQRTDVPDSDLVLLAYGEGLIDAATFSKVKSYFNENKLCMVAYVDEDFYWGDLSSRMQPWFKPSYSPDTLLAYNYWGHLVAVKKSLLTEAAGDAFDTVPEPVRQTAGFYDLCLRLEEAALRQCQIRGGSAAERICHISGVLFHRLYRPDDNAIEEIEKCESGEARAARAEQCLTKELEEGRYLSGAGADCVAVREAALRRRGCRGSLLSGPEADIYHVVYDTTISGRDRCARAQSADGHIYPHPLVSVVIPSKDHPEVLEQCLKSFRKKTLYDCYEWIVVDNGSGEENRAKIQRLQKEYGFLYLYEEMPFNFSRMCNLGAARARGDMILLLNDDIEIIEKNWLGRMVGQALQPHTGAVGAKLWYAGSRQIQHAGITNLRIGPSHKLVTFQDDKDYYYGHNRVTYNMIGVTAACLMVTKRKYNEVGGLDEEMAVSYNDVDFCFKLAEAGYCNVLRNDVVLYHHESLSRGLDEQDGNKWERLLEEKRRLYRKHPQMDGKDSYYHEALIDNASDYRCNYKFPYEDHLRTAQVRQETGSPTGRNGKKGRQLMLTVDRAELQHKIHEEEPDILWIMGWCYVPGEDNALFERKIVLRREDGLEYTAVPADWYRKDVEATLRGELHIKLSGFVLRVLTKDLEAGCYQIGMLYTGQMSGENVFAWSDKRITL